MKNRENIWQMQKKSGNKSPSGLREMSHCHSCDDVTAELWKK